MDAKNERYNNLINELKLSKKYCLKIIEYNKTGVSDYPVEYYMMHLNECAVLEQLDIRNQAILWDLYLLEASPVKIAEKYNFERTALYKHIKKAVMQIC